MAVTQRASVRSENRQAFAVTSGDVADAMASALRRDTDFVATMGSTVASWPQMSNAQFTGWITSAKTLSRYPGGIGYAFIADVRPSQLAAFGRRMLADPIPSAFPARRFVVIPAGVRAYYCIIRLGVNMSGVKVPLGFDECAAALPGLVSRPDRQIWLAARDTGQTTVSSLAVLGGVFDATTPVYRGGVTPATVAERRAALLGWASGTFIGQAVIAAAGGVRPGLRVQISHRNPGQAPLVIASAGSDRSGSQVLVKPVSADGSWTVRVTGSSTSGLSATAQFWIVLLAGVGLSGLLFGFVRVLARSRGRALRLVARQDRRAAPSRAARRV